MPNPGQWIIRDDGRWAADPVTGKRLVYGAGACGCCGGGPFDCQACTNFPTSFVIEVAGLQECPVVPPFDPFWRLASGDPNGTFMLRPHQTLTTHFIAYCVWWTDPFGAVRRRTDGQEFPMVWQLFVVKDLVNLFCSAQAALGAVENPDLLVATGVSSTETQNLPCDCLNLDDRVFAIVPPNCVEPGTFDFAGGSATTRLP